MAEKDQLVPQSPMQHDPYKVRGTDFSVTNVMAATGQSGSHGTAEGKDQLATNSSNQDGPRFIEDGGPGPKGSGTPTSWESGGRSGKIASAFPVKRNDGESGSGGVSSTAAFESVDLATGKISAKGYSATRVGEVPENKVSIPSR